MNGTDSETKLLFRRTLLTYGVQSFFCLLRKQHLVAASLSTDHFAFHHRPVARYQAFLAAPDRKHNAIMSFLTRHDIRFYFLFHFVFVTVIECISVGVFGGIFRLYQGIITSSCRKRLLKFSDYFLVFLRSGFIPSFLFVS